ncbi:MAG: DNA mismatch repair endonuclease MutH [Deltaproteobacteria bacterium]|nr:MAG: DNA mismatch repair endonuclease MutH [Deltaproteobacteria bacterium]
MKVPAPRDEAELLARAEALAGRRLAEVAADHVFAVPEHLRRHKGWIGQLVEAALGATAGSRAEPDFPHLGVELKTLPVDETGKVTQSTFVCSAQLDGSMARTWEECWVRKKLARVLWVPIVGDGPPGERLIGTPLLWSPDPEEDAVLRADWEEHAHLIGTGQLWQVNARRGQVLQVRPKAANASDLTWTLDEEGEEVRENPRGFYLRARFTRGILERHFF